MADSSANFMINKYVHIIINISDQSKKDILIAHLSEIEIIGFEEKDSELHAYCPPDDFDELAIKEIISNLNAEYSIKIEEAQNWNAVWESNFEPVTIDDFCVIRADFHPKDLSVAMEVIITPKMSFGTGHHATTYLMVQQMHQLDFVNKKVADFGTGTGVLAIVAEKSGGNSVWAIDYDDNSIENAKENITRNHCSKIEIFKASVFSTVETFDIILANINKNVIIDNIEGLIVSLKPAGKLLLSGLLKKDEYDILMVCQGYNLKRLKTVEKDNWIAILFEY